MGYLRIFLREYATKKETSKRKRQYLWLVDGIFRNRSYSDSRETETRFVLAPTLITVTQTVALIRKARSLMHLA